MANIDRLGSGIGYIYATNTASTQVLSSIPNTPQGVEEAKRRALTRAPLYGDIVAFGVLEITVADGADTLTQLNINGVNQITNPVAITAADETQSAADIAAEVNSTAPASGVDYTAVATGGKVILYATIEAGTSVNGHALSQVGLAASTFTLANVAGGSDGSGIESVVNGEKYYLNATTAATIGNISGADDISFALIMRGMQAQIDILDIEVDANGAIAPSRQMAISYINVDSNGGGGADDLDLIDTDCFSLGDILMVSGQVTANVVTLRDVSVSTTGNIQLSNQEPFSTGDKANVIMLRLEEDTSGGLFWYELTRAPVFQVTRQKFYDKNVPVMAGSQDVVLAIGGGTLNLTASNPISDSFIRITGTGLAITGANQINLPGSDNKEGQRFTAYLSQGGNTLAGGSVEVFGLTLTAEDLASGGVIVDAWFSDEAGSYIVTKYYNFESATQVLTGSFLVDQTVDTAQLADDAVTTVKIIDDAVTTPKILDLNVTEDKIASGAVTVTKLGTDEQKTAFHISISFEATEQGEYQIPVPFKCDVIEIFSRVTRPIAATDLATIQFANAGGNMTNGVLSHVASAPFGDTQSAVPSGPNTEILAGGVIRVTTAKTTPGGKATATVFVQRKA